MKVFITKRSGKPGVVVFPEEIVLSLLQQMRNTWFPDETDVLLQVCPPEKVHRGTYEYSENEKILLEEIAEEKECSTRVVLSGVIEQLRLMDRAHSTAKSEIQN